MAWKGNDPMPSCNLQHQQEILDTVATFRGKNRNDAEWLLEAMGPRDVCIALHAMRRWYSYNCWNAAKKLIPHRDTLSRAMDIFPESPVDIAYRGFKVPRNNPLADVDEGDVIQLPVQRNNGCSSWTLRQDIPHRFSGKTKDRVGLVIRLVSADGCKPFIAPPSHSTSWWNKLYCQTMGTSFRDNEAEYAIYGKKLTVEIVAVKR